ncbi:MAG: cupredoxin domain-containing protein [Candidatus Sericytochromatia bacterium]|nr:cupredoxin domain-containing protein [Candidatus Sericytochromatia bacterium]
MRLRTMATACLVLPFLMSCPASQPATGTTPTGTPSAAVATPNTILISNFQFSPPSLNITAGTTVTWVNNDAARHTATADDQTFDSGDLQPGRSYPRLFGTAGTFFYHCNFHHNEKATITVK